jgi:hypothetical protein
MGNGNVSEQDRMTAELDTDGKWLCRVGGVSALALVAGYLLTFPVYAWVGDAPPSGVEPRLEYFAMHATGWWIILGLMVFTDLLYVPIYLSLYQALKRLNRDLMRLALACMGLFVVLDLALTWTSYSTLLTCGRTYAAATTDARRSVSIATGASASAVLDSPLLGIYAIVVPALGYLFIGLVMLKGVFNKPTAYLALATGLTGLAYLGTYITPALDPIRIVNALLATVWFGCIGWRLRGLGKVTRGK